MYHSQNHFTLGFWKVPCCPERIMSVLWDIDRISSQKVFNFMLVTFISLSHSTNVYECYLISLFILAFHKMSLAVWRCGGLTLPKRDDRIFSFPLRKGRKCVFFSTMSAIRMCFIAAGIQ